MAEFVPRQLDACEVDVLAVLVKFAGPVRVALIVKNAEPVRWRAGAIGAAISRLRAAGYIARELKSAPGRYYRIPQARRGAAEVQVTLRGAVDTFTLREWVLAALWHSGATCPKTKSRPGLIYAQLISGWGKQVAGADVFAALTGLVTAGYATKVVREGNIHDFYATRYQRDKIRKRLAHFPLMPGYLPPIPDDITAFPDVLRAWAGQVHAWLRALGRPARAAEITAALGRDDVAAALDLLAAAGHIGRLGEPGWAWSSQDVVWAHPDRPAGPALVVPDTVVSHLDYGQLPVFALSADEVAVLREAMRRKVGFGPFIISKKVFGDTPHPSPPSPGALVAPAHMTTVLALALRARPVLAALARKGMLAGDLQWGGDGLVPCRHDNYSIYRMRPRERAIAAASLDYTTGRPHCTCGGERGPGDITFCARCKAKARAKVIPLPGERPVAAEDLKVIHAVQALTAAALSVTPGSIAAFAFVAGCRFNAARAQSLQWAAGVALPVGRAEQALARLVRDGYITRRRGVYWLGHRQRAWVEQNYGPDGRAWPHVAAAETQAATRDGRAVELE